MRLQGKRALIIGVSTADSLGAQVARRFIAEGAKVMLGGIDAATLAEVGKELSSPTVEFNLVDEDSRTSGIAAAVEALGGIDVAINFAGMNRSVPIAEETFEGLSQLATLHFVGTTLFIRDVAAAMTGPGSIMTMSSVTAELTGLRLAAYAGTKAGADKVVRIAAVEYGGRGIRVNSLAPGLTRSPMTEAFFQDEAKIAAFKREIPLERVSTAADVAAAAVWAASDECFQTGDVIRISGGAHLRRLPTARDFELGA